MSGFRVEYSKRAQKELAKLDFSVKKMLKAWIDKNLVGTENPRQHGKQLTGDKSQYWRYRVGNYRIVAEIIDDELVIIAVTIAHRSEVYKRL